MSRRRLVRRAGIGSLAAGALALAGSRTFPAGEQSEAANRPAARTVDPPRRREFELTFDTPGEYDYFRILQGKPDRTGKAAKVIVTEGS